MKYTRSTGWLISVMLIFLGCITVSSAYADDYSEVSQLLRSGKYPEALAKADQFLSSQPKDAQMRFLKGVIQRESGKTSDAVATFSRLTEDYPELPEPYNNLAVLYAGQGQYDRARTALETAIRTNPSYSTAHENLGDVYAKLASQAYNKALQLDNSNAAVVPKLALIKELFAPGSAKSQRPGAPPAGPTPPQIAALTPSKAPPAPPALPAPKPIPVNPAPAGNGNSGAASQVSAIQTQASTPAPVIPVTPTPPITPAIPAKSPPAPAASTPVPTISATATATKEIEAVVRAWAAAWAAKDVKTYLSLYAKEFETPGNMSRANWEDERRARINGKSNISVKLDNLAVNVNGTKATAKFKQDYKANGLAVSSRKVLELSKTGERWHIVKESIAK